MSKCPCEQCISFAICNSRKPKTVGQFIIDTVYIYHCILVYRYIRDEADPEKGLYQVVGEPIELESVREVARIFKYDLIIVPTMEGLIHEVSM